MSAKISSLGLATLCASSLMASDQIGSTPMIVVKAGTYESFVPERPKKEAPPQPVVIEVKAFVIDQTPVSNGQYLEFLAGYSDWKRDKVGRLFADASYLSHWESSILPGAKAPLDSPVVHISWFAARAYCKAKGKRLPTTDEWEYVAGLPFYGNSPAEQAKYSQQILEWYAQPTLSVTSAIPRKSSHRLGISGLHGLIWEWTSDFASSIASDESREDASADGGMFCGAGAIGGKDPSNYANYMRFALRSSLKGGYSLANLGFRCARDQVR